MRKRGEDALEDLEERWHGEEEEEDSGALGAVLAVAAGVAATYFLTSDRAAPARSRVRETAEIGAASRPPTGGSSTSSTGTRRRGNGQPGALGRNQVGRDSVR